MADSRSPRFPGSSLDSSTMGQRTEQQLVDPDPPNLGPNRRYPTRSESTGQALQPVDGMFLSPPTRYSHVLSFPGQERASPRFESKTGLYPQARDTAPPGNKAAITSSPPHMKDIQSAPPTHESQKTGNPGNIMYSGRSTASNNERAPPGDPADDLP